MPHGLRRLDVRDQEIKADMPVYLRLKIAADSRIGGADQAQCLPEVGHGGQPVAVQYLEDQAKPEEGLRCGRWLGGLLPVGKRLPEQALLGVDVGGTHFGTAHQPGDVLVVVHHAEQLYGMCLAVWLGRPRRLGLRFRQDGANAAEVASPEPGLRQRVFSRRQELADLLICGHEAADRVENIRRIGEVAKLMTDAGLIVLCSFISPYRAERRMVRELLGGDEFIEVFVDTPIDQCIARDPKGLYARALAGEIKNFTGVDQPYEAPENPELHLMAGNKEADRLAIEVVEALERREILKRD